MISRDQPYIHFYVNDFFADEKLRECSAESIGVYIMLMCILHKQEEYGVLLLKQKYKQTLKQNFEICYGFASQLAKQLPFETAVIERSIKELSEQGVIRLDGDRLCQPRMVKDALLSQKRATAGRKGGMKKAEKTSSFATANANSFAIANCDYDNDNDYNNIKSNKNNIKYTKSNNTAEDEKFTEFWSEYPRKVAKAKCKKAWENLEITAEMFKTIMQALREQKKSPQWTKDDGQYIPHPITWINQRRWENEMEVMRYEYNEGNVESETNRNRIEGFKTIR